MFSSVGRKNLQEDQATPCRKKFKSNASYAQTPSNEGDRESCEMRLRESEAPDTLVKEEGTIRERADLLATIAEKEEKLRKLKMVKTYSAKNNLAELQSLIDKWRDVSQQAVQDLASHWSDTGITVPRLIQHFNLDVKLLQYSHEDEAFY